MNGYAITTLASGDTSFRAVASADDLLPGEAFAETPPSPTLDAIKRDLCLRIDATADAARAAVASDGLRLSEYEWALAEAQAFKDAGYTGDAPQSLAIWIEATGWTAQAACDNILQTAAAWESFRAAVRRRLIGKANVNAASDAAGAQAAADAAIAEINASLAAVQG